MLAERTDARPNTGTILFVEGRTPNKVQIEENERAKAIFSQEVEDILAPAPSEALEIPTFRNFLEQAVNRYPRINSRLREAEASIDVLSSLKDDDLWVKWGVVKSMIWETDGPAKFGTHFGISGNTLQTQIKHFSAVDIVELRTYVDQIVTQEAKAS